jgi:hypothetical protein
VRRGQDWLFNIDVYRNVQEVLIIDNIGYNYRMARGNNASSKVNSEIVDIFRNEFVRLRDLMQQFGLNYHVITDRSIWYPISAIGFVIVSTRMSMDKGIKLLSDLNNRLSDEGFLPQKIISNSLPVHLMYALFRMKQFRILILAFYFANKSSKS